MIIETPCSVSWGEPGRSHAFSGVGGMGHSGMGILWKDKREQSREDPI